MRKMAFVVLLLGLCGLSVLLFPQAGAAATVNLLPNASFETDTSPVDGTPDGYTMGALNGSPTRSLDTAEHYDGGKSVKFVGGSTGDRANLYYNLTGASAMVGNTYVYSIYHKTNSIVSSSYGTAVRIAFLNTGNQLVKSHLYVAGSKGTAGWTRLEVTFTVPYGTDKIVIEPMLFLASGTVWWDQASLVQANIINNSGFETDASPADGTADGWTKLNYGSTTPTIALDTMAPYAGTRSVKMVGGAVTDRSSYSQTLNVTAYNGQEFKLSVFQKTSGIASSSYGTAVRLIFLNASSQPVIPAVTMAGNKGTVGWTNVSGSFVIPKGTVTLQVEMFLWLATGTVWWDEMELSPVTKGWISDSSFENDADGNGLPYAWEQGTAAGGATLSLDPSTKLNGTRSLRMAGASTSATQSSYQDIIIPAGATGELYTFSSWYKTNGVITTGSGAAAQIQFYNSAGSAIGITQTIAGSTGTNDWTQLNSLISAPAGTAKIRITLLLHQASGTVWWDLTDVTPFQFVANPGFESDENADGVADGWEYSLSAGSPVIALDGTTAHAGGKSLKMTGSSANDVAYARYKVNLPSAGPGVSAGGYKVSVYHKVQNLASAGRGSGLYIYFRDAANNQIGTITMRGQKETHDWSQLVKYVSVPAGAVRMEIYAFLINGIGTIWWDSVDVTPVPMLDNQDVERDADTNGVPDGWTFQVVSGSPAKSLDGGQYYATSNGNAVRSFKVVHASSGDESALAQTVPLSSEFSGGGVVSVQYRIEGVATNQADADAASNGARIKLTFLNASDVAVGNPLYSVGSVGSAAWSVLSQSFIPPSGASKIKLELQLRKASGTIWWDQAELQPAAQLAADPAKFIGLGALLQEGRPGLRWSKPANAASYSIQYSQDSTFSTGTTTVSNLIIPGYNLPANLADGTWYARGTTTDSSNVTTGYGPTYKFFIQRLQAYPDNITPNGDGANDQMLLHYILQDTATVTLEVRNAGNTIVRTLHNAVSQGAGSKTVVWDGKNDSNAFVPDGAYTATLTLVIGGVVYVSNQTVVVHATDTLGYRGLENNKDWSGFYTDWIDKAAKLNFNQFDAATGRYSGDLTSSPLWPISTSGYAFILAYDYVTPGTTYYNNTTARDRAIAAFDAVVEYEVGTTGSWARERELDENQDRFVLAALVDTYPLLDPHIDAATRTKWKGFLQRAAQYQIDTYKLSSLYGRYPNTDQTYAMAIAGVGAILNNSSFQDEAADIVQLAWDDLQPNGGLSYINGTNPTAGYQTLTALWARYYDYTSDPAIPAMAAEMVDYFPLAFEVDGVSEDGTAPAYKNYWATAYYPSAADTIAHFTSDGRNKMVANTAKERFTRMYPEGQSALQQVFFISLGRHMDTSGITPVKLTDQGVVKDPDIEGLRARWGTFNANITAGKIQPTLVSAVVNNNGNPFAGLNGALGFAYFESKEGNVPGEVPSDWAHILPPQVPTGFDTAAQSGITVQQVYVNSKIGAQQTKFIPVPYYGWIMTADNSANWDWKAQETWVLFKNRLIGMNSMSVKETNMTLNSGPHHFARSRLVFGPVKSAVLNTQVLSDDLYGNYNQLGFWLNKQSTANWEFKTDLKNGLEPGTKAVAAGFRSLTQIAIQKKADGSGNVTWGPYSAGNADDRMSYHAVFFPLGSYANAKDWHDSADNNIAFSVPQADVHAAVIDAQDGSGEVYAVVTNHAATTKTGSLPIALANGSYTLARYVDDSGTPATSSAISVAGGSYSLSYNLTAGSMAIYKINP